MEAIKLLAAACLCLFAATANAQMIKVTEDYERFTVGYINSKVVPSGQFKDVADIVGSLSGTFDGAYGSGVGDLFEELFWDALGIPENIRSHGFHISYIHGFHLSKRLPFFIEAGLQLQWRTGLYSSGYTKLYSSHGHYLAYGDLREKINMFSFNIPIYFTYRLNVNKDVAFSPFFGFDFRLNLLAMYKPKLKDAVYPEGGTIESHKAGVEDELFRRRVNLFNDDDAGVDLKRFQAGWRLGLNVDIRHFNLSVSYGTDFNEILKDTYRIRNLMVSTGMTF